MAYNFLPGKSSPLLPSTPTPTNGAIYSGPAQNSSYGGSGPAPRPSYSSGGGSSTSGAIYSGPAQNSSIDLAVQQKQAQANFDASGGIKGVNASDVGNNPIQSISGGIAARTLATNNSSPIINQIAPKQSIDTSIILKQERIKQLSNAGFNSNDISNIIDSGDRYTYYNNKIVPQGNSRKQLELKQKLSEQAQQEELTGTLISAGIVGVGAVPLIIGAGPVALGGGLLVAGMQGPTLNTALGSAGKNGRPSVSILEQKEAYQYMVAAQEKTASSNAVSGIAYNYVPGGQAMLKRSGIEGATKYFLEKGYSQKAAETEALGVYNKYSLAGSSGELIGLVVSGGGSELIGRVGTKVVLKNTVVPEGLKFFSKEGLKFTAKAGAGIMPAGALEGFAYYNIENTAKGKKFDPINAAYYTGAGTLSAGLIGGSLVTASITNKNAGKWLQRGLYTIDTPEKPGDMIGNAVEFFTGKSYGPSVRVNTIIPAQQSINPSQSTKSLSPIIPNNSNPFITTNNNNNIDIFNNVTVPVDTTLPVNPIAQVNPIVPVNPNPTVPINNYTNTETNTETNTTTNVFTNVFTPVNTNIPVMAATGLPFLPFGAGGLGDSPGRGAKRQRTKFYNETAAAFSVFNSFISGAGPVPRPKKPKNLKRPNNFNPFFPNNKTGVLQ